MASLWLRSQEDGKPAFLHLSVCEFSHTRSSDPGEQQLGSICHMSAQSPPRRRPPPAAAKAHDALIGEDVGAAAAGHDAALVVRAVHHERLEAAAAARRPHPRPAFAHEARAALVQRRVPPPLVH